jgi:hypothetical protein
MYMETNISKVLEPHHQLRKTYGECRQGESNLRMKVVKNNEQITVFPETGELPQVHPRFRKDRSFIVQNKRERDLRIDT